MLLILFLDFWLGTDAVLSRPGLVLSVLALTTVLLAAGELADMFSNAASRVDARVLALASFAMVLVTCVPVLWDDYPADCALGRFGFSLSGVVVGFVVLIFMEMVSFQGETDVRGEIVDRIGRGALTLIYLNMLFAFLLNHRFLNGDNRLGLLAIVTLITTVKLSDASAYFAGKSYGRRKMAPKLSPGKTIEGAIGGFVGGCAGALIVIYLVGPWLFQTNVDKAWWWVLIYGVLVTAAGMFGDLAESLIKRDTHTKDSSRWLPGLGGILDVVDSLVFAAPVSYLLWI